MINIEQGLKTKVYYLALLTYQKSCPLRNAEVVLTSS